MMQHGNQEPSAKEPQLSPAEVMAAHQALREAVVGAHLRALAQPDAEERVNRQAGGSVATWGWTTDIIFSPIPSGNNGDMKPSGSRVFAVTGGDIVGHTEFILSGSATPSSYNEKHPAKSPEDDAKVPFKVVNVDFPGQGLSDEYDGASIIVFPVDVPVAIRSDVFGSVERGGWEGLVARAKEVGSPDTVSYLSPAACQALAMAINASDVRISL